MVEINQTNFTKMSPDERAEVIFENLVTIDGRTKSIEEMLIKVDIPELDVRVKKIEKAKDARTGMIAICTTVGATIASVVTFFGKILFD